MWSCFSVLPVSFQWIIVLGGVMSMTSGKVQMTSYRDKPVTKQCVKTGPCSCRTPDGIIDLSPLADNFTARYKDVPDTQGADMYSWNPCLTFSEGINCIDVAACQLDGLPNGTKAIGTQDSAQFIITSSGDLTLQYTYPDPSGVNRTTVVTLKCDPNAPNSISVYGEMVPFHYSITLMSAFACVRDG